MSKYIRIKKHDMVAVALESLSEGTAIVVGGENIVLRHDIPKGHKFALTDMEKGAEVYKYGYPIGRAKCNIQRGEWVHTHNMETGLSDILEYTYEKIPYEGKSHERSYVDEKSFWGYRRADGRAGVRNEIWIIPTVGCVNNVAQLIAERAKEYIAGSIDNICAYTHPYGCS